MLQESRRLVAVNTAKPETEAARLPANRSKGIRLRLRTAARHTDHRQRLFQNHRPEKISISPTPKSGNLLINGSSRSHSKGAYSPPIQQRPPSFPSDRQARSSRITGRRKIWNKNNGGRLVSGRGPSTLQSDHTESSHSHPIEMRGKRASTPSRPHTGGRANWTTHRSTLSHPATNHQQRAIWYIEPSQARLARPQKTTILGIRMMHKE